MPIMRYKNYLRLTGEDAQRFLDQTGRSKLPTTLREYQYAIEMAAKNLEDFDSSEGNLLAFLIRMDQLVETELDTVRAIELYSKHHQAIPPLYLKDAATGSIEFTEFGLAQFAEEFAETEIDIHQIQTEADFEATKLQSIRHNTARLMCKTVDYPELDELFQPFIAALKREFT